MTIEDIKKQLLDEVNRPQDTIWLDRADKAIKQALARLFVKFDFALFRVPQYIPSQPIDFNKDFTGYFQRIEAVYRVKDETDTIYTGYPCNVIEVNTYNIDRESIPFYRLMRGDILRQNLNIYFGRDKNFLVDGFLTLNESMKLLSFNDTFLPNVFDYILMDCWIRFCILLNEDVEKIGALKTLRDEAYNDVMAFNTKFTLNGPIVLKG